MSYGMEYDDAFENEASEPDEKALEAARMESRVFGRYTNSGGGGAGGAGPNGEGETPKQTLRRLFEESSPAAAQTIIKLSMAGSSERVRLDASKYIVERVLPSITGVGAGGGMGSGDDAEPGSLEHTLAQMAKNIKG